MLRIFSLFPQEIILNSGEGLFINILGNFSAFDLETCRGEKLLRAI